MTERPDWRPSWPEVPEGHEVVAVPSSRWRIDQGHPCSRQLARHQRCGKPSAAAIDRQRHQHGKTFPAWYPCCLDHMYGNWIENGQVMHWILRKIGDADA